MAKTNSTKLLFSVIKNYFAPFRSIPTYCCYLLDIQCDQHAPNFLLDSIGSDNRNEQNNAVESIKWYHVRIHIAMVVAGGNAKVKCILLEKMKHTMKY